MRSSKRVIGGITFPILTLSNLKKDFYLLANNYNDPLLNDHKSVRKTLEYITEAKKTYFNKQICNCKNKIKPTWNVVKTITGRIPINNDTQTLNIGREIIRNY